jgi:hypothetical protein
MKTIIRIFILSFFGLYANTVFAEASLDSGSFTVAYQEPVANADGTVLDDLAHTTIYYSLDGGARIKAMDIPASATGGGGNIQQAFVIDGLGSQVDVLITYTATDISGNESLEFVESIIRIDKVAPGAPIG